MKAFVYILALLTSTSILAQNPNRIFKNFKQKNHYYLIEVNDGTYEIEFLTDQMVQTSFIPKGESFKRESHAVVIGLKEMPIVDYEDDKKIEISTFDLKVKIQKSPFQISYYNNDNLIISEKEGYRKDSLENIQFNLKPHEILYGGGARALGMNRRGHKLELYNRAHYGYETHSELMNYTMPIVVSSERYMIHFDNAPIGFLDLDSKGNNTLEYQTISGRKTYQVIVGNDWEGLIANYTELTGRQPMLPRWALGNFSSRFGYHSQEEVTNTIQKFRDEEIPVDAVILDLYWFGKEVKGTMGNLKFDVDSFPQPKKMIQDLRKKNVETILITEPFLLTTSDRWNEAVKENILAKDSLGKPYTYDFFFGNTGLIDIYSKEGYNWFSNIYKDLIHMGVTGMWGDLGEPEVHPSGLFHAAGTADEVHNIYGHDWARLVQSAYADVKPQDRPFILMRAAYSGSQRYGIVPWTGDVNRTWGGLQSQPEIALQMGMQGIGYMHSDLGGFAGDNLDDELYVRWLQYGVFQPIFRPHAQEDVASEPVFRSEWAKNLSREAINLRYQLLPYNYNLVFENYKTGKPLMRPLFFEESDNIDLMTYSDAYFWGDDFVISPVLKPAEKTKKLYLPKTANWVDFYSKKKYEGGKEHKITLKEDYIPTFVRSGAIIPMAPKMQSTKEYNGDELIINYYFDDGVQWSSSHVYNDNGLLSEAYQKGAFEQMVFAVENQGKEIVLNLDTKLGHNYKSGNKEITWVIYNLTQQPKSLKIGDKTYPINWKKKSKVLKIKTNWNSAESKSIRIQF